MKALRTPHHLTHPYFPWSNGAVERRVRKLIRVSKSILSELRISPEAWPDLLPISLSALNNAPSRHCANSSPLTAFTGLPVSPPIATFLSYTAGRPITVTDIVRERSLYIKALQDRVEALFARSLRPLFETTVSVRARLPIGAN